MGQVVWGQFNTVGQGQSTLRHRLHMPEHHAYTYMAVGRYEQKTQRALPARRTRGAVRKRQVLHGVQAARKRQAYTPRCTAVGGSGVRSNVLVITGIEGPTLPHQRSATRTEACHLENRDHGGSVMGQWREMSGAKQGRQKNVVVHVVVVAKMKVVAVRIKG